MNRVLVISIGSVSSTRPKTGPKSTSMCKPAGFTCGAAQRSVSQNSPRFYRMVHVPSPSAPINVLRVITRLNIGGPAIHAILLTQALDDGQVFTSTLVAGTTAQHEG